MIALVFILSMVCLAYTYAGYPLLLHVWFRQKGGHSPQTVTLSSAGGSRAQDLLAGLFPDKLPTVSIIVAAYNEAADIDARVRDLLSQDYPSDRLEVLVGSDGSTDGTVAAVNRLGRCNVRVLDLPRQGRAGVHNACVAAAHGDILIFTDAATQFAPDCVRRLVMALSDPAVGCVSGQLVYTNTGQPGIARGAGWYWRYELLLRRLESVVGSSVAVTGACMAMRRSLFRPLAATDDIDDAAPIDTLLAGHRVVIVSEAIAYDRLPDSTANELAARRRMATKNLSAIVNRPRILLVHRYPEAALKLISHRVMRYLSPLFLMALLVANAFLPDRPLFNLTWNLQLLFYGMALVGFVADRFQWRLPIVSLPFAFCLANVGFLLGLWNVLRGHGVTLYEPIR